MAIQVPVVERFPAQDTPSVGRLDVNPPNVLEAVAPQTRAVNAVAEATFDAYNKKMDEAADNLGRAAANEFRMNRNEAIEGPEGLIYKKGDPSQMYQDFDNGSNDLYERIVSQYADANPKTKASVQKHMQNAYSDIYNKRTVRFGKQYNDYADTVTETNVALMKRKLNDDAELVQAGDPNSISPLKGSIVAIMDARYEQAGRQGLAKKREDGSWEPNDIVNLTIANDASDAVKDVILTYTNAGRPDLAEMVMQDKTMHNILDTKNMTQVKKAIEDSKLEVQSTTIAQKAAMIPDSTEAYALIKKETKNPLVQEKARKILDDIKSSQDVNFKRDQKIIYDKLSNDLQDIQAGLNPNIPAFVSVHQMETHPYIRERLSRLEDGDKRKALKSLVSPPKESDPEALMDIATRARRGDLLTMSSADLVEATSKLNQYNRSQVANWVKSAREKAKTPESASAERARWNDMNNFMLEKARLYGIVPKKGQPETWKKEDRELYETVSRSYMDVLSGSSDLDQKQQQEKTINFLIDYMNNNPRSKPGFFEGFFGGGGGPSSREYIIPERPAASLGGNKHVTPAGQVKRGSMVTPYISSLEQIPDADLDYYAEAYKSAGGKVTNEAEFIKWINDNPRGSR